MIGIIIAMEQELRPYLRFPHSVERVYGKDFYHIDIDKEKVIIALSGIGKVNATYSATLMVTLFHPEFLLSTGVSGGLGISKLIDIVVASSTCQHDVDTSALGDPIGLVSTVNKIYFETSENLSNLFCKELNGKRGVIACGDQFIASADKALFVKQNFGAIACDMESGAIGQVAYICDTPFVAIRCISDGAEENASLTYEKVVDYASEKLGNAVISVIKNRGVNNEKN